MTTIQEVRWELEWDYIGNPYYVSGHAIYSALARRLPSAVKQALHVSPGVFVPSTGGASEANSQSSGELDLRPVEEYADLFGCRDAAQRWLSETQPRDAQNTHTMRQFGDRTGYGATQPVATRSEKPTPAWYIHAYCHTDGTGHLPLADETLDGLCLGGARNYGFGRTTLEATRTIDLGTLSYARLDDAEEYHLELQTPYVLASNYPGADEQTIPWWWAYDGELRRRDTHLRKGDATYELQTVDHGQIVTYAGNTPITTAKAGVLGVGTHSKYGFGQFRLRPASEDRVLERTAASTQRGDA